MSELNPVRIAVIGAGAMGRNHIRFVTEEPEAELVAIAPRPRPPACRFTPIPPR